MKTVWAALALATGIVVAMERPATAEGTAPAGAVACVSVRSILHYSDAIDSGNSAKAQRLLGSTCRMVEGMSYSLVEEHNGTVKIMVFKKPGDWESAETLYTLAEMLQLE